MDLMEAMNNRHSVRQYRNRPLEPEIVSALEAEVASCNRESGLHIQLVTNQPEAFDGFLAHYGKFRGVANYFALVGRRSPELEEKCGYYGERLVLRAQQLGLNTCWVALTYRKGKAAVALEEGETLCLVIALGYGETQGTAHRSKPAAQVIQGEGPVPEWFRRGVQAALLAPTAVNQQKFRLGWDGRRVTAKAGAGFYTKVDLGIVKYHFELGAGKEQVEWA